MGTKVKITWNNPGFGEIMNSPELANLLEDVGKKVAKEAGDGFEVNTWTSSMGRRKGHGNKGRVAVSIKAETKEAKKAEAEDKVLTKAVERCRKG